MLTKYYLKDKCEFYDNGSKCMWCKSKGFNRGADVTNLILEIEKIEGHLTFPIDMIEVVEE